MPKGKTSPSIRQDKSAKLYAEAILKGKPVSKAQILKQAGYSKAVQRTPSRAMNKEGFKMALEKYLPVDSIVERLKDLMHQDDNLNVSMKAVDKALDIHGLNTENGGTAYAVFINHVLTKPAEANNESIEVIEGNVVKEDQDD